MVLGHFGNLQFRQPTKMTRRGKEPSKRVNLWNTVTFEVKVGKSALVCGWQVDEMT